MALFHFSFTWKKISFIIFMTILCGTKFNFSVIMNIIWLKFLALKVNSSHNNVSSPRWIRMSPCFIQRFSVGSASVFGPSYLKLFEQFLYHCYHLSKIHQTWTDIIIGVYLWTWPNKLGHWIWTINFRSCSKWLLTPISIFFLVPSSQNFDFLIWTHLIMQMYIYINGLGSRQCLCKP